MTDDPSGIRINELAEDAQPDLRDSASHIPLPGGNINDESGRHWDAYLSKILVALALLSGTALTFYVFVTYRVQFHSDAAVKNLLADEIVRTRQFFPSDWYYANDILILTPHLIIIPLRLFFRDSFMLHALACFVFAALFAGSLYLLCNASGLQRNDFLLAVSLLLTGLSPWVAENVFGEFAYGGPIAGTFVVIALVFRALKAFNESNRRSFIFWSVLLVAFLSIVLASGVRGIFLDVVPTLATLTIVTLAPRTGRCEFPRRGVIYVGLLIIVAVVLGMGCFFAIRLGVHFQDSKSATRFVDYQHLRSNVGLFFEGFLGFAGAMPEANRRPISLYGFITAYRLFWFGLAMLLPFWLLFRYRRITNPHFQFLIVFYAISFLATSYLYIFSSLPENVGTFRYCLSPFILAIVLIACAARELRLGYGAKSVCVLVTACLPIYAGSYQQLIAPYFQANPSPLYGSKGQSGSGRQPGRHENSEQPLVDYLVSQDLRYGYATYWNAGLLTVLSGERTHVSAVFFTNPPVPMRWLCPAHQYAADAFHGRTFFLLTDEEYRALDQLLLKAYLGPPESVRSVAGYKVIVYGFNVAAKLPGWEEGPKVSIDEAYTPADLKAELDSTVNAVTMNSGQPGILQVKITDQGHKAFASGGQFPIYLGIHLYSKDLQPKDPNYLLSPLPRVLKGGESLEFPASLAALPQGEYVLEVSMVQGGVAWFGTGKDGRPLRIKLNVRQTDEIQPEH